MHVFIVCLDLYYRWISSNQGGRDPSNWFNPPYILSVQSQEWISNVVGRGPYFVFSELR
jgi:hypothetical protein